MREDKRREGEVAEMGGRVWCRSGNFVGVVGVGLIFEYVGDGY